MYSYFLIALWCTALWWGKVIVIISSIITLAAFWESYTFVNSDQKIKFLEEPSLFAMPPVYGVSAVVCVFYNRLVFRITYERISTGRFSKRITLSPIFAFRILFSVIFGISWVVFKWTLAIIKLTRHTSLANFLFYQLKGQGTHTRRIAFFNGEWRINANYVDRALGALKIIAPGLNQNQARDLAHFTAKHWEAERQVEYMHEVEKINFNKATRSSHLLFKDITLNSDKGAYMTSKPKADFNHNYGREVLINEFEHLKKSTLLQCDNSEVIFTGEKSPMLMTKIIVGGAKNGFNSDLLSLDLAQRITYYQSTLFDPELMAMYTNFTPEQKEALSRLLIAGGGDGLDKLLEKSL